mgnify:CR=1 FL=1
MTWLDNQIKDLEETNSKFKEEISKIKKINPKTLNEFLEATPLKLVFLDYSLKIYVSIIHNHIKNSNFFDKMFYIDLFCGSGLDRLKSKNDLLIGSPFIAILNHRLKFNSFFFCDNNKDYYTTLKSRIEVLGIPNTDISKEDCNLEIDKIIETIKKSKKSHSFFFIDPYSTEFNWASMNKVLKIYGDVLFTFMTPAINRIRDSAFAQSNNKTEVLDKFFGDKSWNNPAKDVVEIYKENILKIREKGLIESVRIADYYDLIFITNKTKKENRWMRGIIKAKKEIESNSKQAVKIALDKCKRGQKDLSTFWS